MNIKNVLKKSEIEVIQLLEDEKFNIDFFTNQTEVAENGDYLLSETATGYYTAVKNVIEANLHIYRKAYLVLIDIVEIAINTIDNNNIYIMQYADLSNKFKIALDKAEDLFITAGEENE